MQQQQSRIQFNDADIQNERPLKGLRGLVVFVFIDEKGISEGEATTFSEMYLKKNNLLLSNNDPEIEASKNRKYMPPFLFIKIGKDIIGEVHERGTLKRDSDFQIDVITWSFVIENIKVTRNNYFEFIKKLIDQLSTDYKNDNSVKAKKP